MEETSSAIDARLRRRRSSCTEESGYTPSDYSFCDESTITTDAASTWASSTTGFCIPQLGHTNVATFYLKERLWSSRQDISYKVRQNEGTCFPCGLHVRVKVSGKTKGRVKVILRDDDKRIFAVCSKEQEENSSSSSNDCSSNVSLVYKIFSASPTIPGKQRPAKKTSSSRMRLYHWAQVLVDKDATNQSSPTFTMDVWDGKEFVKAYTCRRGQGGSINAATMTPVCIKPFTFSKGDINCGFMEKDCTRIATQWQVSIVPGFDPCLILCFASIVDDLLYLTAIKEALSLKELALSLSGMMVSRQPFIGLEQKSPNDATSNQERAAATLNESATSLGLPETSERRSGSNRAA